MQLTATLGAPRITLTRTGDIVEMRQPSAEDRAQLWAALVTGACKRHPELLGINRQPADKPEAQP